MGRKNLKIKLQKGLRWPFFEKSSRSSISQYVLSQSISSQKGGKWLFGKKSRLRGFDESDQEKSIAKPTPYFFYLVILGVFFLFIGRLFILTIVEGDKFRELAENNRIKLIEVEAKRGNIYDRNDVLLARSEVTYTLKKDDKLSQISETQAQDLEGKRLASWDFEAELGQIFPKIMRRYYFGEILAHILGYTTVPQKEDRRQREHISLLQSIGTLGAEESYDDFLRGQNGKKLVEIDSRSKNVSILGSVAPKSGRNIYLTIDSSLQKVAYEVLLRHAKKAGSGKGAVVIQNPNTGEILTLVSLPSFNGEDISKFLNDKNEPFFNRVISGSYPPGSIFKIVTALSGLESGVINKDTQIEDVGEFKIANDRFVNWYFLLAGEKDGFLKVDRAIARSNDIFFYRVAERTGLESLRTMAIKFGFGQKTGIDITGEAFGLVPDKAWKQSAYGTSWFLGDTLHLGIGQGFMLSTPLQINSLISYIASAKLMKPFIVSEIDGGDGASSVKIEEKVKGENLVSWESINSIREGMRQACEEGGTAFPFFNAPYKIGCKTGTAEKTLGNPHAWFTAFAPFENPQISITVIIEDGGEGSRVAAPVAREILDWMFRNKKF